MIEKLGRAVGVDVVQRFEDAVGAGDVVVTRENGFAARGANPLHDLFRIGRDDDPADLGRPGPPPDVDDHGLAGDIDHGLSGQARRRHAGRDDDQGACRQELPIDQSTCVSTARRRNCHLIRDESR